MGSALGSAVCLIWFLALPFASSPCLAQGSDRFAAEHLWGKVSQNNWEPTVAADPGSNWVYQLTSDQDSLKILFRGSSDSGDTWGPAKSFCGPRNPNLWEYDPQIQVSLDGTIYAACLNRFNPGVVFTKSTDHGETWTRALRVDGKLGYSDKPILLISPSGQDVYLAFNDFYSFEIVVSHDFGASFSSPLRVNREHLWFYPYGGTVSPDGTVYFAVGGEGGNNQTGPVKIELVRSSDGGQTWKWTSFGTSHEGAVCKVRNCYPDFFDAQTAVASDSSGLLLSAYTINQVRHGPNQLYIRTSTDGIHWSAKKLINSLGNSTSPAVAPGPAPGDFRLVWQDNRNGPHAWNTWYSRTTDGGRQWSSAIRLSNRGSGAPYKTPAGYKFPFGDYFGLAVNTSGGNFVIWGEGDGVYANGGTWYTRGLAEDHSVSMAPLNLLGYGIP